MSDGLLDLPAPLFDALDSGLAWLGLPPLARLMVYATASAWVSMALYRKCSRQDEIKHVSEAARSLRAELADYDGPFDGLLQQVSALFRLSARHLGLSFGPALLSGLPILLVLPWLSNSFEWIRPQPGDAVSIQAIGSQSAIQQLRWNDPEVEWNADQRAWKVSWPDESSKLQLQQAERILLELPLQQVSAVVHQRIPVFNWLIGNPSGYLPDGSAIEQLNIELKPRELIGFGPSWLRNWLTLYLTAVVLISLLLRWKWKIH
ncbi:hypothetical protein [Pseudomarimonas arenosa]|uniref:Uncharacterized protein n=1 Tax=Pseudomarimonas arenosa TaxID=2774145 RepID=A0AAW3ZQ93_9GAMM|nr:hypothetical protein [Pseudomarimonas arenosa]MBD8526481.1 hypothetical protein [Pseudomarimonas arenosa]